MKFQKKTSKKKLETLRLVQSYGDILYDLCASTTSTPHLAREIFQKILKRVRSEVGKVQFSKYEKAWVLSCAYEEITKNYRTLPLPPDREEKILRQSLMTPEERLAVLPHLLERLSIESQLVLLFREKHKLPIDEISVLSGIPVRSLEIKVEQAYHDLFQLVWHNIPAENISHHVESILQNLEHRALPEALRKNPFQTVFIEPNAQIASVATTKWRQVPWYLRSSIEGIGIAAMVFIVVVLVPKLRSMYQENIDKQLKAVNMAELSVEMTDINPNPPGITEPSELTGEDAAPSEAETPETDEVAARKVDLDRKVSVGNSEIWRLYIKSVGVAPRELRPKIHETLIKAGVASDIPEAHGIVAPGGIQFNLLVSKELIPKIKADIQGLVQETVSTQSGLTLDEVFTWYMSKSRRRIPPGQTRLVIWISQV